MSNSMITWCIIAGVLLCAFIFRAVERYYTECHRRGHKSKPLFEIGMEEEILFIPGDVDDEEYFEDL